MDDLPYVGTAEELTDAVADLSSSLLWRLGGYDERPITPAEVAVVLSGLDAARERFLQRAALQVAEARHLHLVKDVG